VKTTGPSACRCRNTWLDGPGLRLRVFFALISIGVEENGRSIWKPNFLDHLILHITLSDGQECGVLLWMGRGARCGLPLIPTLSFRSFSRHEGDLETIHWSRHHITRLLIESTRYGHSLQMVLERAKITTIGYEQISTSTPHIPSSTNYRPHYQGKQRNGPTRSRVLNRTH
jgi:hypothetical protein